MKMYPPPPPPAICPDCGGQVPQKDVMAPPPPDPHHCTCPNCMVIGPGHEPCYLPDWGGHVCQNPPNEKAAATEKARLKKMKHPLKLGDANLAEAGKKHKR